MSGVWETLFREEKQDWLSWTFGNLTNLIALIMEVPCTLFCFISAGIAIVWEFIVAQALAFAELIHLHDWWTIEHCIASSFVIAYSMLVIRRGRGDRLSQLVQLNAGLVSLFAFGTFLWLAAGIQPGGVAFGGRLVYPSLALLYAALYMARSVMALNDREVKGYGLMQPADESDPRERVNRYFGRQICLEMALLLSMATYGLPSCDGGANLLPWLGIFPFIKVCQVSMDYFQPEASATASTDNGSATKIQDGPAEEAPAAATETAKADEPAAEKKESEKATAEGDSKAADEAKPEEKTEAAEPAKPSVICQACESVTNAVKGLVCRAACLTCRTASAIINLPWHRIIGIICGLGTSVAGIYTQWTLTEDYVVLGMPVCIFAVPFVVDRARAKGWMGERGQLMMQELSIFSINAVQYYLVRTHVTPAPSALA